MPRIYEVKFSFSPWLSVLPPLLQEQAEWDWSFHPDHIPGAKAGSAEAPAKHYSEEVI